MDTSSPASYKRRLIGRATLLDFFGLSHHYLTVIQGSGREQAVMDMRLTLLIIAFLALPGLTGCTPLTVAGVVGTTISRSLEDDDPGQSRRNYLDQDQVRRNVAITNLNLGTAYMQQGDYKKALAKLQRAEKADPDYAPVYNVYGVVHQELGNKEKAEQYFTQAIDLAPGDSSVLNNYGLFLCRNDRVGEAEAAFKKAAENRLYKTPEIALTNAGTCVFENGQTGLAENYFRQALQLNPSIPPALIQMSEITYHRGELLSARNYLQRYLESAGHTPKSLWLGIRIEQELGDKNAVSSYALLLRNLHANSQEAALLRETDIR